MREILRVFNINYGNIGKVKYSIYRRSSYMLNRNEIKVNFNDMKYIRVFNTYFLTMYLMDLPIAIFMSDDYFNFYRYILHMGIKSTYLDTFEIKIYYESDIGRLCVVNSITESFSI